MDDSPEYEWDEGKCQANRDNHDVDFDRAKRFDWTGAGTRLNERCDYGEPRYISIGDIDGKHTCLCLDAAI